MRDGLKSYGIGQSAAKGWRFFEVTTPVTDIFTDEFVALLVGSTSAGRDVVLEMEAQFSLLTFANQVRENVSDQVGCDAITPYAEVNGSTGFDGLCLDMALSGLSNEFNGAFIAHSQFNRSPVLKTDGASISFESVDSEASFTVKQTSDVRFCGFVHNNLLSTFNDYPEREYGQVAGSAWLPSDALYMKEGEIVFSSSKDEAANRVVSVSGIGLTTDAKTQPYVGDDYMAIAWPTTLRTFKNNLETLHQYTASGIQLIFNGEIGRYENVRYTEQTNVSKGITSTGSSGTAWANGKSDWIFFMGEDTVVEGVAIPEEIRAKIPTDYGRSKGVAYYYVGGFGIVHTNAVQSRIVMWDSAA